MTPRRLFTGATALAALAALAGCQMTDARPARVAVQPMGVEGTWQDPTGGIATFSGGIFETVAADTGEKLSRGSYSMTSAREVAISGTSMARQRRGLPSEVAFNCLMASPSQLNCTGSDGTQFVLVRRSVS